MNLWLFSPQECGRSFLILTSSFHPKCLFNFEWFQIDLTFKIINVLLLMLNHLDIIIHFVKTLYLLFLLSFVIIFKNFIILFFAGNLSLKQSNLAFQNFNTNWTNSIWISFGLHFIKFIQIYHFTKEIFIFILT